MVRNTCLLKLDVTQLKMEWLGTGTCHLVVKWEKYIQLEGKGATANKHAGPGGPSLPYFQLPCQYISLWNTLSCVSSLHPSTPTPTPTLWPVTICRYKEYSKDVNKRMSGSRDSWNKIIPPPTQILSEINNKCNWYYPPDTLDDLPTIEPHRNPVSYLPHPHSMRAPQYFYWKKTIFKCRQQEPNGEYISYPVYSILGSKKSVH